MTNKYTLKDLYKWSIERDYSDSRNMVLSVEYNLPDKEHVFISKMIYSPDHRYAQVEIVKTMDKIKQEYPELFADYENTDAVFKAALNRVENLSDAQLDKITMSTQALAVSDDD